MIILFLLLFSSLATITILLVLNKSDKAKNIKSILMDIYSNLKELSSNIIRLYKAVRVLFPDSSDSKSEEYKVSQSDKNVESLNSVKEDNEEQSLQTEDLSKEFNEDNNNSNDLSPLNNKNISNSIDSITTIGNESIADDTFMLNKKEEQTIGVTQPNPDPPLSSVDNIITTPPDSDLLSDSDSNINEVIEYSDDEISKDNNISTDNI